MTQYAYATLCQFLPAWPAKQAQNILRVRLVSGKTNFVFWFCLTGKCVDDGQKRERLIMSGKFIFYDSIGGFVGFLSYYWAVNQYPFDWGFFDYVLCARIVCDICCLMLHRLRFLGLDVGLYELVYGVAFVIRLRPVNWNPCI